MQDWSDSLLDRQITSALRAETVVTPGQKHLAWERLRERAAQERVRAPAHVLHMAPILSPAERLHLVVRRCAQAAASLLFDDTRYDRALNHRRTRHPYSMLHAPLRTLCSGVGT